MSAPKPIIPEKMSLKRLVPGEESLKPLIQSEVSLEPLFQMESVSEASIVREVSVEPFLTGAAPHRSIVRQSSEAALSPLQ